MLAFAAFGLLAGRAVTAHAQWGTDSTHNTAVCKATSIQQYPKACSDGSNGVIIVWEDLRSGSSYDIYAQRLDANGNAMWQKDGVPVCTASFDQKAPIIAPDNNGGAYVVWQDSRTVANGIDLYAQHVNSDGTLSYTSSGLGIGVGANAQNNAVICSDGSSSAWVAWEDNRASSSTTRPDIYVNRLTTGGASFGTGGLAVATQNNQQHRPSICEDGSGGCYIAWENNAATPTAIYANRLSSSGAKLWSSTNGIEVYRGDASTKNARNVNIRRDGNEVMMAWEVTSSNTTNGQDIMANRLHSDSTKVWYSAADVTGEWFGDQTLPKVFSDDSVGLGGESGLLVVFQDLEGSTENDVAMVRVLSDGGSRMPDYVNGFYFITSQPLGQNGFRVVPVDQGNLLAVWNDSRKSSTDTSIYAQRVDRTLKRYFPNSGFQSTWGLPVSVSSSYQSKSVTLAPRTNGAIAAWTDLRNGNADIYAQLIFKDGSLPIELASFSVTPGRAGDVLLQWKTASEKENAGFAIERRQVDALGSNAYETVADMTTTGSLRGAGTSNVEHNYAYTDQGLAPGHYEYRLIDIALDGTRTPHDSKLVEVSDRTALAWSVGTTVPNPSNGRAVLPYTLKSEALVTVSLVDATGRTVATPEAGELEASGAHQLSLDLSSLHLANGNYMIRLSARDANTGAFLWQSEKPVLMQIAR